MPTREQLVDTLVSLVVPLVHADRGELYLVRATDDEIVLHLAGTCSGCPGATLTTRGVIEPVLRGVSPHVRVVVTSGVRIPEGAERLGVDKAAAVGGDDSRRA